MTIIAVHGDMMLADSHSFRGETGESMAPGRNKIEQLADGSLLGCCGSVQDIFQINAWARAGMNYDKPPRLAYKPEDDAAVEFFHLRTDRTLWRCHAHFLPFEVSSPNTIGMRDPCLLWQGAVDTGCNPIRALEYVISRCALVGGDVHYKRLQPLTVERNGAWTCTACQAHNRELHERCLACCMPRR